MIHRHDQLLARQLELARRCLQDPHVRLVGNEPVDIREAHAGRRNGLACRLLEHAHRVLEDALSVHLQERRALDLAAAHVPRHRQHIDLASVGVQARGMDSRLLGRREHHRPGPVAEEHAGAAVVPIEDAREHLRAHHQSLLVHARSDETIGRGKRIDEAGAHRLHVEGSASLDAELRLQLASRAREDVIRRRGGHDDEINLLGVHPGGRKRVTACFQGEIARGLRLLRDVPALDAGALADPGIARLEAPRELLVLHHALRQVASGADDSRIGHWTTMGNSAIRAAMRCGTLFSTSSSARSSAWPNAYASAEPWLLITIPFRPSRLAPLYLPGSMRLRMALRTGFAIHAASMFQGLRMNSWRRKSTIIVATPSEALRSTLPTKPSHTTTSVVPL